MNAKTLQRLELNKILSAVSEYCSLDGGKRLALNLAPSDDIAEVRDRLAFTRECDKLLYVFGAGKIENFGQPEEVLKRAEKGSSLNCAELLNVCALLRSSRCAYQSIVKYDDGQLKFTRRIADGLCFNQNLEADISEKIISVDSVSDRASDRLYSIRSKIKSLNERIRSELNEYVSGKSAEFLQDSIVTMRNDRYVIPVKAEYKSRVKGFVHDRSKTGATYFIEPEYVLELNNELVSLQIDEREEVEAILKALSGRVGQIAAELWNTVGLLYSLDCAYAVAEYCYYKKCTEPEVNARGIISINKGRHPLIEADEVVPVNLELGEKYNFLLLSGANTGGKTVTMKMCGLFCLMAACGLFIPAASGSKIAVFGNIFCGLGDSQSIEESLSTFSSHIADVTEICREADGNSLVLIDELGGGTNPDEGQAIAKAVVKFLLEKGAKGIITTHFTALKEFAYTRDGIENASMEFDSATLRPLYSVKIGLPGASNALAIAGRLGMDAQILSDAMGFLSVGARSFENILQRAEESRVKAEEELSRAAAMKAEWQKKLSEVNQKIEEVNREREKISRGARSESRRIIAERTERAEEILAKIEEIFGKAELSQKDLIEARTLKNKLKDEAYEEESERSKVEELEQATAENLRSGVTVFIKPMQTRGTVVSFNPKKGEAEILCGSIKMHLKTSELSIVGEERSKKPQFVKVVRSIPREKPLLEINVLGLTVVEALYEVDNFIDRAVTDNLPEVKIIHGVGTGKLKAAIWEHLKRHKNVDSLRLGKYGEGETGVTFVKLK